jgi:alkylation response protein AidB-like acyl-CoA dehydrogenase
LLVPEHLGGMESAELGLADLAVLMQELGRFVAAGPTICTNVVLDALVREGSPEQQEQWLEPIVEGEQFATCAGGAWSTTGTAMPVQVEARADGGAVLTGVQTHVEYATVADLFLVTAEAGGRPVQYLVPARAAGVRSVPVTSLDLARRYARVHLDDVMVSSADRIGGADAAPALDRQRDVAVVLQCAESVGVMGIVFELTAAYLPERLSFGRPLASYQALKHRFADMKLWLEASFATATAAAKAVDANGPDAAELASVAKAYIGERATDLMQDCVQLHGGIGVTWEHDIHLYLRRATVDRVMWGTPAEHRRLIADFLNV